MGDGTRWSEIRSFTTGYVNTDVEALIFGDLQESDNTTLTGILNGLDLTDYDLTIQTWWTTAETTATGTRPSPCWTG